MSLDLTEVDPDDGKPWDFTQADKKAKAKKRIIEEKPFLLIGCPPCIPFSTIFETNISRMDPNKVAAMIQVGIEHLNLCAELCQIQIDAGRFFLHEHPLHARSWKVPSMVNIANKA